MQDEKITEKAGPSEHPIVERAREIVNNHLKTYYRLTLDDVEIETVPGYWREKKECGGRGVCHHPLHGCLLNEGSIHHTVSYHDSPHDERGRWASTTRTWKILYDAENVRG